MKKLNLTNIEDRLINWGLCQRGRGSGTMASKETRRISPYGGTGYVCMTGVVCNMMKMAAIGQIGGLATQSRLDFEDAAIVNRAWMRLAIRHKLLLKDLYALGRPVNIICRELDIKHWPASHFKREIKDAQNGIAAILDSGK